MCVIDLFRILDGLDPWTPVEVWTPSLPVPEPSEYSLALAASIDAQFGLVDGKLPS